MWSQECVLSPNLLLYIPNTVIPIPQSLLTCTAFYVNDIILTTIKTQPLILFKPTWIQLMSGSQQWNLVSTPLLPPQPTTTTTNHHSYPSDVHIHITKMTIFSHLAYVPNNNVFNANLLDFTSTDDRKRLLCLDATFESPKLSFLSVVVGGLNDDNHSHSAHDGQCFNPLRPTSTFRIGRVPLLWWFWWQGK